MNKEELEQSYNEAIGLYDQKQYLAALRIFRKQAPHGEVESMNMLGVMYGDGAGVLRSFKTALQWLFCAAYHTESIQGKGLLSNNIACTYRQMGQYALAHKWFKISIMQSEHESWLGLAKLFMGPLRHRKMAKQALMQLLKYEGTTLITEDSVEFAYDYLFPVTSP